MENASIEVAWRIIEAIFDRRRFEILKGLAEGKNATRVASELGLTRGGIQHHLEMLKRVGLIDDGARITDLGRDIIAMVEKLIVEIVELVKKHKSSLLDRAISEIVTSLVVAGVFPPEKSEELKEVLRRQLLEKSATEAVAKP